MDTKDIVVPTAPPGSDEIILADGNTLVVIRKSAVDAYHGIGHDDVTGQPTQYRVVVRGGHTFFVTYTDRATEQLATVFLPIVLP